MSWIGRPAGEAQAICPNEPSCGHYWHDVEDYDDPVPTCCAQGCQCGKTEEHRRLRQELLYGASR